MLISEDLDEVLDLSDRVLVIFKGAIVAEYFGGSRSVLGQFIITEAAFFRFANAWAAIVVASAVSIAFFLIILAIERVAIPWHASARITDSS